MVMKAAPAASFEMAQTKFLFEFLIVAFDNPALFAQKYQWTQSDGFRQVRQPVLRRLLLCLRPFDQQPLLRMRFTAPVVAMGHTHAQAGKTRVHGATRTFAPTHAPPVAGTETEGQFLHRERLMVFISAQKTGRAPGCIAGPGRKRSGARRPDRSRRLDTHDIL